MKVKVSVAQWCLTLCHTMDCSPPDSSVHGILQARILEWVAMPSFRGSSQSRDWNQVSHIASGFFTTEPPEPGTQQTPCKDHTGAGVPPTHPTALPPEPSTLPSTQQEHNKHQLNKWITWLRAYEVSGSSTSQRIAWWVRAPKPGETLFCHVPAVQTWTSYFSAPQFTHIKCST